MKDERGEKHVLLFSFFPLIHTYIHGSLRKMRGPRVVQGDVSRLRSRRTDVWEARSTHVTHAPSKAPGLGFTWAPGGSFWPGQPLPPWFSCIVPSAYSGGPYTSLSAIKSPWSDRFCF